MCVFFPFFLAPRGKKCHKNSNNDFTHLVSALGIQWLQKLEFPSAENMWKAVPAPISSSPLSFMLTSKIEGTNSSELLLTNVVTTHTKA